MLSIVLEEPRRLVVREEAKPEPGPGEVLVRVRRIGVCGTDLHAFAGNQPYFDYPRILGHELAVEIEAFGETEAEGERAGGLAEGVLCTVYPYLACGTCTACRRGKPNCCAGLGVLGVHRDGGMREFMILPAASLVPAGSLDPDQAALVENQCIGAHAVERAGLREDELVLVIGAGPIGLGVIQFAVLAGARVVAMDVSTRRLEFCRGNFRIEKAVDAAADPGEELRALTAGEFFTTVFEATGNAASMRAAISYVSHGGQMILVGLVQDDLRYFHPEFHKREMTLKSSRNATPADFERVIAALESKRAHVIPMVTHRASLADAAAEFENWLDPASKVIKALIEL
jgi:2-desacetyl-2-hydroxyethyl bacteriochlorophyllide A dehydrogenase